VAWSATPEYCVTCQANISTYWLTSGGTYTLPDLTSYQHYTGRH